MYWMGPRVKTKRRQVEIRAEQDVWLAVGLGTMLARELGMESADCARVETAISEIARNALLHGGGGCVSIEQVTESARCGLRVCAQDVGPGITDTVRALEDGFSTLNSLGIGLGVTKRLMDDFAIRSHPGWGTVITATKWKRNGYVGRKITR